MAASHTEPSDDEGARRVPRHVAIIMDGNGRWAKARRLPVIAGHRAGVETIRRVMETCRSYGVDVLTLFAFSSENWQRPRDEVRSLMALFMRYLRAEARRLNAKGIRLRVIGSRERFAPRLQRLIEDAEFETASNRAFTLVVAADYGGQWDITQAVQSLVEEVRAGRLAAERIDSAAIEARLSLAELPRPDLLIRTGGDHRVSNFLLWQIAYTELYFCECFWPDFDEAEFEAAMRDYAARERRFGARPTSPTTDESAQC